MLKRGNKNVLEKTITQKMIAGDADERVSEKLRETRVRNEPVEMKTI